MKTFNNVAHRPERQPASLEDVALRQLRLNVLEICKGNRTQAATVLGIDTRILRIHLNKYRDEGYAVPDTHPQNRSVSLPERFWKNLAKWLEGPK
jgi:DNA-binding NtrC family response regulator